MSRSGRKKFGIVDGGQFGRRDARCYVVRKAALEAQAKLAALLLGKRKTRALGCVQMGATKPLTRPLEFMGELTDARLGFDASYDVAIVPQIKALAAMHGRRFDTGEFTPPTAPAAARRKAA